MKKTMVFVAIVLILLTLILTGCNRQIFDTTYKFDRAILSLPNGQIIEGQVDSWIDYEDGDQIQVKINGTIYLTHANNVVLIKD